MQMHTSKRIVLNTFGTHGDILPFVGIAKQLQALGHRPVIATSTLYEPLMRSHGVDFLPVGPHFSDVERDLGIDLAAIMKMAFDPLKGGAFLLQKMVLPYFEQNYEELKVACEGADMLISQPTTATAFLVALKRGLPWRTVVLQPMPLRLMTADDPANISNFVAMHRLHALIGSKAYGAIWKFIRVSGRGMLRFIDDKSRVLGIYDKSQHPMFERVFSPEGTIALFPKTLMRKPQAPGLPPNISYAGFSYFDGGNAGLPPELQAFLDKGAAPVTFTLGSAIVMNPGRFYEECSAACEKLGVRAVFLTGKSEVKRQLPASQIAVPWASHAALFPRSMAVVDQGGIGTCAQALRAGVPQLVVPHSLDQPDNATRLNELGVALRLMPWRTKGRPLVRALDDLVNDASLRQKLGELKPHINQTCGTQAAAQILSAARPKLLPEYEMQPAMRLSA